jgi:hypothetical protein
MSVMMLTCSVAGCWSVSITFAIVSSYCEYGEQCGASLGLYI